MGRAPCCDKNGLKKGPWTPEEDQKLIDYIHKFGYGNWRTLPKNAGLQRCGKSCRLRWTNYLRPDIKRGRFSFEEEETIIQLHSILGNKWSAIAARLPGRTDNEIKNYWNTHIRKRLLRMGLDPVTHSPRLDLLDLSSILGNSFYDNTISSSQPSQMNMSRLLGLQPLINPNLLKLASSFMSNQPQNPSSNTLIQDFQRINFNPIIQTTQIQTPIQNPLPTCTTITTTTATTTTNTADTFTRFSIPLYEEPQLIGPTYEQYPTNIANLDHPQIPLNQWENNGLPMQENLVNMQASKFGYYDSTYQANISENQSFLSYTPSIVSSPSSSLTHLNSSSNSNSTTYINSNSGTEDEKESYCSEMIKFEIPDFLDVNQFLLAQTN
ncbi:unnamed protein product [Amaranthus hypochondriacus]